MVHVTRMPNIVLEILHLHASLISNLALEKPSWCIIFPCHHLKMWESSRIQFSQRFQDMQNFSSTKSFLAVQRIKTALAWLYFTSHNIWHVPFICEFSRCSFWAIGDEWKGQKEDWWAKSYSASLQQLWCISYYPLVVFYSSCLDEGEHPPFPTFSYHNAKCFNFW